jgi:N-acyl-D-aspartate/D-glutamate deacylase
MNFAMKQPLQLWLRRIGIEHRERPRHFTAPALVRNLRANHGALRYVRDLKVITLEEAVRKATSHNPTKVRIFDHGILRSGMWADVAVFNPNTVIDTATFENPHQYAVGFEYVSSMARS